PCAESDVGKMAACFSGLRAQRNVGICKDGVTTCVRKNEITTQWGPCVGQVLPQPDVAVGPKACRCFSGGQWKIDNTTPCFVEYPGGGGWFGMSTMVEKKPGAVAKCPEFPKTPPPT